MTTESQSRQREPIVDPDGGYLWLPVEDYPDKERAVLGAMDYSPGRPCYVLINREWMVTRPINEDNPDDVEFSEEYGCQTIADASEPGVGYEYWCVALYPDMVPEGLDRDAF